MRRKTKGKEKKGIKRKKKKMHPNIMNQKKALLITCVSSTGHFFLCIFFFFTKMGLYFMFSISLNILYLIESKAIVIVRHYFMCQ